MSPQVRKARYEPITYNPRKADVYSLGVTGLELARLAFPKVFKKRIAMQMLRL